MQETVSPIFSKMTFVEYHIQAWENDRMTSHQRWSLTPSGTLTVSPLSCLVTQT